MLTRRPVASKYRFAASSASSTDHLVLMGTSSLRSETVDRGDEAHRGNGHVARGEAEAVGLRGDERAHRPEDGVVVGEGLPHPHEHHV